jgi:hypothetical protein
MASGYMLRHMIIILEKQAVPNYSYFLLRIAYANSKIRDTIPPAIRIPKNYAGLYPGIFAALSMRNTTPEVSFALPLGPREAEPNICGGIIM